MAEEKRDTDQAGDSGSSATALKEKPTRTTTPKKRPPTHMPPWKVLLHNDDQNEMGYVVATIVELTSLKKPEAILRMKEAHETGVALLLTTHKERAELYRDQFASKGLTVTIEAAE